MSAPDALFQIAEAIRLADSVIEEGGNSLLQSVPLAQLKQFRVRLERMKEEIETDQLPERPQRPEYFSRPIVDSWPLRHPLTQALLQAEESYRQL